MTQRVLVIDDSQDIHRLLDVRLRPEGIVIDHALDAEQGLAMARTGAPDLILLDIGLPGVTGFEVCRLLKTDPLTANVPVIFLTGASEVHDKVEGFDLGAVDYVTKPFEPAELRARVRAALRMKRYNDLLAARSHIDGLTGIWNRAYFDQRLSEEVSAALRYGRDVSLVMLDLDHFKALNDDHGHPFGDQVLQRVGEVLGGALRATDAPCRYGGEEFAIVMTQTDLDGATTSAERLRAAVEGLLFRPGSRDVRVTASLGVASAAGLDRGSLSAARLLAAADDALYLAKRGGRNRVCTAPIAPAAEP